jgi:hypothetical protein
LELAGNRIPSDVLEGTDGRFKRSYHILKWLSADIFVMPNYYFLDHGCVLPVFVNADRESFRQEPILINLQLREGGHQKRGWDIGSSCARNQVADDVVCLH